MHTNLPAAEAALLTLIAARQELTGVAVTHSPPTKEAEAGAQHVWLGETTFEQADRGAFGQSRDDTFSIEVIVVVYQAGDDDNSTRARCWQITQAIQDAVSSDHDLSGLLNIGAEVTSGSVQTYPADAGGWAARADLRVTSRAVLINQ